VARLAWVSMVAGSLAGGLALLTQQPLLAVLVAVLVTGACAALMCRSIVQPLRELPAVLRQTELRFQHSLAQSQRDRAQMVALFEHMADGLLVLDADERIILSNPAARRLLRQPRLEDMPLAEGVRDADLVETVRAVRYGSPVTQLIELRRAPNRARSWLNIVATRVPSEGHILVLLQDVTELRRAEAARRDFVANVSHELRTPVASLKALVETLEAGAMADPRDGPDFLRRMHVEVDGLAQLVAELLELARIEAGRLELDLQLCRADELVSAAVERIRPYASRVGLHVSCVPSPPGGVWVQADARRIGQVLSNLLSNAVKFTPPGGQVRAGVTERSGLVEVWVTDSGVGVAADQLLRVFERFYKTDPARTTSGTGPGLAICKHVVRAHGGTIWADSPGMGLGATFSFTLQPAEPSHLELSDGPVELSRTLAEGSTFEAPVAAPDTSRGGQRHGV
jgi:two-component system, OmpR family, phosphate regulon sensor histidine kinase PhoR